MAGKSIDNLSVIISADTGPLARDLAKASAAIDAFARKAGRSMPARYDDGPRPVSRRPTPPPSATGTGYSSPRYVNPPTPPPPRPTPAPRPVPVPVPLSPPPPRPPTQTRPASAPPTRLDINAAPLTPRDRPTPKPPAREPARPDTGPLPVLSPWFRPPMTARRRFGVDKSWVTPIFHAANVDRRRARYKADRDRLEEDRAAASKASVFDRQLENLRTRRETLQRTRETLRPPIARERTYRFGRPVPFLTGRLADRAGGVASRAAESVGRAVAGVQTRAAGVMTRVAEGVAGGFGWAERTVGTAARRVVGDRLAGAAGRVFLGGSSRPPPAAIPRLPAPGGGGERTFPHAPEMPGGAAGRAAAGARDGSMSLFGLARAGLAAGAGLAAVELGLGGISLGFQKLKQSVQLAGELEQTTLAFEVMTKSADRARQMVSEIRKYAASTPFGLAEITGAARQLTAYGVAADQVMPSIRMLGDVSAAFGKDLPIRDLTYLYGTLYAQQRAYAIDIRQFAGRGIPIYEELAKVVGKTTAEVRQLTEDGRISSREVTQAFINMTSAGGRFYGLTARQGKTFLGQLEQMKDAFALAQTAFGGVLIEELGLGAAVQDLDKFAKRLEAGVDVVRPAIRFVGELGRAAVQMGYEFGRAAITIASVNLDAFTRTFPGVKAAADSFRQLIREAADFKFDEETLITFAIDVADVMVRTFGGIADMIGKAYREAQKEAGPVLRTLERINELAKWVSPNPTAGAPLPADMQPGRDQGGWSRWLSGNPGGGAMFPAAGNVERTVAPVTLPAWRKVGDPIDLAGPPPPVPGMAADRIREEYAELTLRVVQAEAAYRAILPHLDTTPPLEVLRLLTAMHTANRIRGTYVQGLVPPIGRTASEMLDRGEVPAIRGSRDATRLVAEQGQTDARSAVLGPAGLFAPERPKTFFEQGNAFLQSLRDTLPGGARARKEEAERKRAAEELHRNTMAAREQRFAEAAAGAVGFPLGMHMGRDLETPAVTHAGSAALGSPLGLTFQQPAPSGGGVQLPRAFPRLQELENEFRKEYDPRDSLELYRKELDQVRERRQLGAGTDRIVDAAWAKRLNEVAGHLGVGQKIELPSATLAGSTEDARLINAWKTQQASTSDQMLVLIEAHVRQMLGLAEKIPVGGTAPPPRPVMRLPGD